MKMIKITSICAHILIVLLCNPLQGLAPTSDYNKFDPIRDTLTQEAPFLSRLNSFEWLAIVSGLVSYKREQAMAWREIYKAGTERERHQGNASRLYGVYFAKGDIATERALGNTITFEFDNLPFDEYDSENAPLLSSFYFDHPAMAIAWRGFDLQRFPPKRIIVNAENQDVLDQIKRSAKKAWGDSLEVIAVSSTLQVEVNPNYTYHSQPIIAANFSIPYQMLTSNRERDTWQHIQAILQRRSPSRTALNHTLRILMQKAISMVNEEYEENLHVPITKIDQTIILQAIEYRKKYSSESSLAEIIALYNQKFIPRAATLVSEHTSSAALRALYRRNKANKDDYFDEQQYIEHMAIFELALALYLFRHRLELKVYDGRNIKHLTKKELYHMLGKDQDIAISS